MNMAGPDPKSVCLQASKRKWQYRLQDLLLLTLGISVLLGLWRVFGGGFGPTQVAALMAAAVFGLWAGWCTRRRRLWFAGLVLILLLAWSLGPADWRIRLVIALPACGVYLVAGLPVLIAATPDGRRWPWVLGSMICFLVPALITPVDPQSMLLVAAPLCLCYLFVAIMWRTWPSALRAMGPALVVFGAGLAVGGCIAPFGHLSHATTTPAPSYAAFVQTLAALALRTGVAVALLGLVVTLAALLSVRSPSGSR